MICAVNRNRIHTEGPCQCFFGGPAPSIPVPPTIPVEVPDGEPAR